MINDLDIVQWAYLLDPCFQLVNTAGKPLTEGYIEVYYHGTRTKYYCASDFDGTLHPFQIPLDSLGSNIVLASPDYAYDVYVYNKFGSLVMSRYNVTPGLGGSGGGGIPGSDLPEHWLGTDGEAINIASDAVNVCLPLPVSGSVDYEGEFVDHFDDTTLYLNEGMYIVEAVIQFRQASWDLHNSLNNLKIDTGDGDSSYYWQEDVSGPESNNNVHERKVTFIRKVSGEEPYPFYISPSVGVQLYDAKIRRLNIVKLATGGSGGGSQPMYKPGPGIAVDDEGVISVTGMQPVSGMNEYVTNITYNNDVTEIFNEIHNVTGDITNIYNEIQSVTGDIHEYAAGSGIIIEDDVISIDPSYIPTATGDVSEEELQAVTSILNDKIDAVSAAVPEAQVNADWNATEGKAEILNKPDLSVYATKDELQEVSSAIPELPQEEEVEFEELDVDALVTNDALQSVTSIIENTIEGATSVIENTIEGVSTTIVNEYTGDIESVTAVLNDKIDAVSAAVPEAQVNADWNATEGKAEILNKPDLTVYATKDEVNTATGFIQDEIMSVSTTVSGIIADQVQSDWDEDDSTDPAYIKNKPEEIPLVAGENIYIERVQDTLVISASSVDLSPYATNTDLAGATAQLESEIQSVSSAIPDEEEVEFEELDVDALVTDNDLVSATSVIENTIESVSTVIQNEIVTVTGEFPDVSNLATKDELESASGTLDAKIDAVSASIPEAQVQSDWTETATGDPAYIKNKPAEYDLVAGQNIEITTSGDDLVINAVVPPVTGFATEEELQTVSSAIPDISNLATKSEVQTVENEVQTVSAAIPDISDLATKDEVNTVAEFLEQDIQTVSAAIPDVSNFATVDEVQTVADDLQIVSAAIPDISNLATKSEVETVAADVQTVSSAIPVLPSEEEVEFEELDLTDFATVASVTAVEADVQTVSSAIPDVSNLATKTELQTATGNLDDKIDTVSGAIVHYQGASGVVVDGDTVSLDEPLMIEAGNGITFTAEGDTITISADIPTVTGYVTESELATATGVLENDIQTVSSAIPDVTNLATKNEVEAVSAAIPELPAEEEVEFEELDLTGYASIASVTAVEADVQTVSAAIPDVSNLATESELQTVSSAIDAVSGQIPDTKPVIAGNGITITEESNQVVIAAEVPTVTGFATEEELQIVSAAVDSVSSSIPETTALIAGSGITITASGDSVVISSNAEAQVNADWNAVSGVAEILNKPDSTNLVAGSGISIVDAGASLIISATGGASLDTLPLVAGSGIVIDAQNDQVVISATGGTGPAAEYVGASGVAVSGDTITLDEPLMIEAGSGIVFTQEGDSIIISAQGGGSGGGDVTKADLAAVSGQLESDIQTVSGAIPSTANLATKSELATVSAAIPSYQGASGIVIDNDTVALDEPIGIVAGQGITFTQDGDDIIISAEGGAVTGMATEADLQIVSAAVDSVSAAIPELPTEESVEFEELDLTDYASIASVTAVEADVQIVSAAIPDVSIFATESELQAVSTAKQDVLTGITDVQVVQALPASPVSSVLYLIPEA